jgi:hypothetical protein
MDAGAFVERYNSPAAHMSLTPTRLGPYEIVARIGAGGPASVRLCNAGRELRRGLAEAQPRTAS